MNLVHYSAKKYFEDSRQDLFPQFHASITLSCATYLTLGTIQNISIRSIVQRYPLAGYAAQYPGDHARQSPEEALESSILDVICQFLSNPDKRKPLLSLLDGLDLIRSGSYSGKPDMIDAVNDGMQTFIPSVASTLECVPTNASVVGALMGDGPATEPDAAGERSSSTLSWTGSIEDSSTMSTSDSIRVSTDEADLLAAKMHANRIPEVTALHLAASMGLAKVASMLLKETPNIDAVDETGKTALAVAIERGFEKAVEFLVNSGACVDLHTDHGRSILLLVTERDRCNAGKIIVERFDRGWKTGNLRPLRNIHTFCRP